jgi:hypothetical protein
MKNLKLNIALLFLLGFSNICFSQKNKSIDYVNKNDSINLAVYLKKISKVLLTKELIEKYKKENNPLTTMVIVYNDKTILTTAKND